MTVSHAQAAGGGQTAYVQVESSMIYKAPNFDAPVLTQLNGGAKVRVSTKKFGSADGPQFYMIKLAGGHLGYVADIDVKTESVRTQEAKQARAERKQQQRQQKQWDKEDKQAAGSKPDLSIFESNFIGALAGIWNYRQDIAGGVKQAGLGLYGIKITTPHLSKTGTMFEANWGFHFGAPKFFNHVSPGKAPSGFLTDLDFLLINPVVRASHAMAYLGLGPLLHFRSITTTPGTSAITSNVFRVGAAFSLGGAYQFGRFCTRLEGKYMWEHTGQTAILASLQTSF